MPIRINLLAEAQALEELRRRDPVKRAMWVAGVLLFLVLAWVGYLQVKIMRANKSLHGLESTLSSQTNTFARIIENQRKAVDISQKLAALRQLATNRFLWGNALNALQQATVNDVQLTKLRGEQKYELTPDTKPGTNETTGRLIAGKPGFVTERITLYLDAKDTGPGPGDQVPKFQETVANFAYFEAALGKTNEIQRKNYNQQQIDPETGKPICTFTLECRFPEKVLK